jgi:hypothetical protein
MWPWEHAILGYLACSIFCHVRYGEPPTGAATIAVVFGSLLPDLIDKPLAWSVGLVETGYAIGHSVFFAVPLVVVVGVWAASAGRPRAGITFGIGYVLHPPADIVVQMTGGGGVDLTLVLWPIATYGEVETTNGFLLESFRRIELFRADLFAGDLSTYMWAQLVITVAVFCLWLYDGAPVARDGIQKIAYIIDS